MIRGQLQPPGMQLDSLFFFETEPAGELPIVLKRREPRKAKYKHV
jgi:hypothetical protein